MDRRLSALVSSVPDINENREYAVDFIKKYNKTPHVATKEDKEWFWQDLDIIVDSESAWDYVNPNMKMLSEMYPFYVTEWFEEFYRYMPEYLWDGRFGCGQIDWNLFFSLAYPLPGSLAVSFRAMINKLNIAQNRIVRGMIKDEIWNDPDLRHKVLRGDVIPSVYTHYTTYHAIRKDILERQKKHDRQLQREKDKDMHKPYDEKRNELQKLFRHILKLQKEGKEIIISPQP